MKLRFAPSPTGFLHVGNARTMLLNWLYAIKNDAEFILRFDDTDNNKCKTEFYDQIKQDMAWLGLTYDQEVQQSQRVSLYKGSIEQLQTKGRLYSCYETKEELRFKRKQQLAAGRPPIYDRAGLRLSPEQRNKLEQEGRKPHWRFQLEHSLVEWQDMAHGKIQVDCSNFSDPILLRENGDPVFTISGIVDDIEMGITHVIRGDDHISNTAVQLQIAEALGCDAQSFSFAHIPLLVGDQGESLSKRIGSLSLRELNQQGFESMAVVNYLSQLGNPNSDEVFHSLCGVVESFDIKSFGKSSPRFNFADLARYNAKFLQQASFNQIQPRLGEAGIDGCTEELWMVVRGNINKISGINGYMQICCGDVASCVDDLEYLTLALKSLPVEPWDDTTWGKWTAEVKRITNRKGKELFFPLRMVLTGMDHGPEMSKLLPLIGYDKAYQRLSNCSL